ncbi:DNA topoisomerase IV [Constantimarinum furrinae]|uniref:DNA topoisomerase IV n=1 Tax=Constantimarinum furrinae TaxID=2562285 RepID=A0A7G8PWE9_9FLAO|nr:DNA topoisomerase IV [Constantimarinum furrinae]QNJ98665.1 hypothetical protein ALE3EI_2118 [Constantimarinum furrinae]
MRFSALFLVFIFVTGCYEPERNCTAFKTGTFEFEALVGTELFTTRIERNDSIEVEYFNGKIDTASVRWINDCEYILKKLNPNSISEKKAIHIKILYTEGNTYTFEFNEVGQSVKKKATATKRN